jgi:hypothetical protein
MKFGRSLLWILVLVALVATGIGGALDMIENGGITKEHAWNDGLFMILLAIFLALVIQ